MKMRYFIILLVVLFGISKLNAQNKFSYSVIKDDPDVGHKLYAGISVLPIAVQIYEELELTPYDVNIQAGIDLNSYNLYDRFSINFYSYFNSGISIFTPLDDITPPHEALDNKIIYNISDLTITSELFSFNNSKEKKIVLSQSSVTYLSYVDQKIKNIFGFRLGYGFSSLPLKRGDRVKNYNDSIFTYIYGLKQHSLNLGISYTNLVYLNLMTDIFGEIEKKSIQNFYFDVIYLLGDNNYYYKHINGKDKPVDYEPESVDKGLSYRVGYENYYNYPKKSVPLSFKLGFEILNKELFNINNVRRNSILFQMNLSIFFTK